ncbi:protein Red [Drosophila elegans]|uniref:protein Red n=1 Tax=Drosophila elegans TaxID=30023 RepID=UPI0007E5F3D1|nr:protein Red [Drosophila elegans]
MSDAHLEAPPSVRLTNDDFRKLLATPRAPPPGSGTSSTSGGGSLATATFATPSAAAPNSTGSSGEKKKGQSSSERNDLRRKKKNFYAALKKQEDVKLLELSEKYRDRARERRDGANPDYVNVSTPGHGSSTNAYRAVAPDMKSGIDAQERRRRIIQESKFLGGDIQHTHLVKGLDYALLQKVRSELHSKEAEEEEIAAAVAREKLAEAAAAAEQLEAERRESEDINAINGALARNIYNLVQARRSKEVPRNELFAPGRMAYVIDLDDELGESDIPTTLKRSKFEVPVAREDVATLTTNDIVINKLSQILSYLRAGGRTKKNKKRDKDKPLFYEKEVENLRGSSSSGGGNSRHANSSSSSSANNKEGKPAPLGDNIYDDVGDYQPTASRGDRSRPEPGKATASYFGDAPPEATEEPLISSIPPPPKISKAMASRFAEPEGYAECYPGLEEMNDAIDDSDDEVDYTKMDLGNKKGPIGRWDFDTQEEYSDYMSTKEALPKAAFQYGVKMQDGRKTRKNKTEKNEKAELDREWQKIQTIIQKRKLPKDGGGGGGGGDEPEYKTSKY